MDKKSVCIQEIRGCEGNCITINDTRIAGPKPWGGGYVIKKWDARVDHILKALGVDVAEVVRCKDCKWWRRYQYGHHMGKCIVHDTRMAEKDFCSYGERKDK